MSQRSSLTSTPEKPEDKLTQLKKAIQENKAEQARLKKMLLQHQRKLENGYGFWGDSNTVNPNKACINAAMTAIEITLAPLYTQLIELQQKVREQENEIEQQRKQAKENFEKQKKQADRLKFYRATGGVSDSPDKTQSLLNHDSGTRQSTVSLSSLKRPGGPL